MKTTHINSICPKRILVVIKIILLIGLFSPYCFAVPLPFQTLHKFEQGHPFSELVQDQLGNHYGTISDLDQQSLGGGAFGLGAIFKIDAQGRYSVLHSFQENEGTYPTKGLILAKDGALYGTTDIGGDSGNGTIFKLDITKVTPIFTVLHQFGFEGSPPSRSIGFKTLIQARDGKFYGTTQFGGNLGRGSIFSFNEASGYKTLRSFTLQNGGAYPEAKLFQSQDGSFFGSTAVGGRNDVVNSFGTLFRFNALGSTPTYTVLHVFDGFPNDGDGSKGALIQGSNGKFYGTTENGGKHASGIIFELDVSGAVPNYKIVYDLSYGITGSMPTAALLLASDGRYYGTTSNGGSLLQDTRIFGSIFRLDLTQPVPILSTLKTLTCVAPGGCGPTAALIKGSDGNLYGTTAFSGSNGGTVFRFGHNADPTTTSLALSYNPLASPSGIDISATVTGNAPGATVTFFDGTTELGLSPVKTGTAKLDSLNSIFSSLNPGSHDLLARYDGDFNNYGSVSAKAHVVVPAVKDDAINVSKTGQNPVEIIAPGVLRNDSDAEGKTLSIVGITASSPKIINLTSPSGIVSGGKVALFADGHFIYTPPAVAFVGTRSFTYQATNGSAKSATATVTLTIRNAPKAFNDTVTTKKATPITINVLTNDLAFQGTTLDPKTVKVVKLPINGTATVNAQGNVIYTPKALFSGTDSFTYTVSDSAGGISNLATVNVLVPEAIGDSFTVSADANASQIIRNGVSLLANDQPSGVANRKAVVVQGITRTGGTATIGALTLNTNGAFNFTLTTPPSATTIALKQASKRGIYKFTYRLNYNGVLTAPANVSVTVR